MRLCDLWAVLFFSVPWVETHHAAMAVRRVLSH